MDTSGFSLFLEKRENILCVPTVTLCRLLPFLFCTVTFPTNPLLVFCLLSIFSFSSKVPILLTTGVPDISSTLIVIPLTECHCFLRLVYLASSGWCSFSWKRFVCPARGHTRRRRLGFGPTRFRLLMNERAQKKMHRNREWKSGFIDKKKKKRGREWTE